MLNLATVITDPRRTRTFVTRGVRPRFGSILVFRSERPPERLTIGNIEGGLRLPLGLVELSGLAVDGIGLALAPASVSRPTVAG